jgi:hypothetical protein
VHELHVIAMRPVRSEPALEVGLPALRQLIAKVARGRRPRPGRVAKRRGLGEAKVRGATGEARRNALDGLPSLLHKLEPVIGKLGIPGVELTGAGGSRADPPDEGVALRESACVAAARLRPGRPCRSHQLVEVRAPKRRSSLHELEPVGQKHAHQRPWKGDRWAAGGRTVNPHALLLARGETHLEEVRPVIALHLRGGPRRPAPRAYDLPLVRRAARSSGEGEVQTLEKVRLAGPVRPRDHREARPRLELGALVVAEIAQLQPADAHRARRSGGSA